MSARTSFILDFDGTITTKDTISTLFNSALSIQLSKGRDFSASYEEILANYRQDYSKHVKEYFPPKEERKTLSQEIEYCISLKDVEIRSFERVSKSGLFKGISPLEWKESGRDAVRKGEVVIREGFLDFVNNIESSGGRWGILSVNFSRDFIWGVLASVSIDSSKTEVIANHTDENGVLIGPETGACNDSSVMTTSDAKLTAMRNLLVSWSDGQETKFSKVVYVGDSGTDIECLSEASVGIIIAEDRKIGFLDTMNCVGVDVAQIKYYYDGGESTIYWARDFREISGNFALMSLQTSEKS